MRPCSLKRTAKEPKRTPTKAKKKRKKKSKMALVRGWVPTGKKEVRRGVRKRKSRAGPKPVKWEGVYRCCLIGARRGRGGEDWGEKRPGPARRSFRKNGDGKKGCLGKSFLDQK